MTKPTVDTLETLGSPKRRRLLAGAGALGGALAADLARAAPSAQPAARPASDEAMVTDAPTTGASLQDKYPFHGLRQQGITTPRPASGMVAAFDVLASDRAGLERLFRTLTERIAFLTQGGPVPEIDPNYPPPDSGILGPVITPDGLTITVSVGESLFDKRFGLAAHKPRHLTRMTGFPNDALVESLCHGDLLLQFCAHTPDSNIHALRDIVKNTPDLLYLRWKQEGTVPTVPAVAGQRPGSARNLLGFHDGTANPDSRDEHMMDRVVWVGPEDGEPAWATHGSYQAVRLIRMFVERWDRTPLQEQESIFGRRKASGAPMDGKKEFDEPDYSRDPKGKVTPLDSHIRLADDRTPESRRHLILRRPFNYSNGVAKNGQMDMGLLFIVYQANLAEGFIAVQSKLNGEPLEEYIKPVGGGYFFVLPGAEREGDFLGQGLLRA
ncbi:deferrochelatase/peroxidase EfeB [Candidimonas humi]|jgi:deferrochelatase/peroxidase EfeB|uniref:Deferrochelatase n=1 Tax=Candidimonas humi TaxID=683355 RepID=A0ABV8P312_9BURK|nr:iron uptake transporter deferrochelatase/peroxidase subunit [Candidimonas humi]MBV6305405.1 deferrochelatase/peroxidase EfeB [Candidimonas humi]